MIPGTRTGLGGWQTMLADLALILFLVSASALDRQADATPPPIVVTLPAQGAPVAIWRDGPGAPALAEWAAGEQHDPRLQLTLLAAPADGARALALAADVPDARIVIQPAGAEAAAGIVAVLAYDRTP